MIFRYARRDLLRFLPGAVLALLLQRPDSYDQGCAADPHSPWQHNNAWRLNEPHAHRLTLHCHGEDHEVLVEQRGLDYIVAAAG